MALRIGGAVDHSFEEPLGLLTDCHRRIEKFMQRMADAAQHVESAPDASWREITESTLTYFRNAAPRHTSDEEESLFPRLRNVPGGAEALDRLAALESDHARADALHEQADELLQRWLDKGPLSHDEAETLRKAVAELQAIYEGHIRIEDEQVFPLAAQLLDAETLRGVGREMAHRRGISPDAPRPQLLRPGLRKL